MILRLICIHIWFLWVQLGSTYIYALQENIIPLCKANIIRFSKKIENLGKCYVHTRWMAFDKKKIWWCLILWSYFDMHRFHELYVHCRYLDDVFLCVFEIDCSSKVLKNAKFEMRNGLESNHVAILLSFQYNPRVIFP